MGRKALPYVLAATTALSGCISLSATEQKHLSELQSLGIDPQEKQEVIPPLAGLLNLGPGLGNFYLAFSSDHKEQALIGVGNLLLWYLSVIWGVPEAWIDGNTINKEATINHYFLNPEGQAKLNELRKKHGITSNPNEDVNPRDSSMKELEKKWKG